jgi:hypothetical protein
LANCAQNAGELALRDADHCPQKLLLADRALMRAWVDETREVPAKRADSCEVALGDLAPAGLALNNWLA